MRVLALVLALAAADQRYGFTDDRLNQASFDSITGGSLSGLWPTPELKALSVDGRAAAVTSLGKAVRGIVESQAFKQRWAAYVKEMRPQPPKPKRSYEQIFSEMKKQIDDQKQQTEKGLQALEPKQRKEMLQALDEAFKAQLEMYKDKEMVENMESARVTQEQLNFDEEMKKYPDDFNAKLKTLLAKFIADTEGVDFSAKTVDKMGKKVFVNGAYEGKSDLWKKCYRAGKPATEAARGFAKDWLTALGK